MFGLILEGEDVNIVKGHDVGFEIHLEPLTIHHELVFFSTMIVTAPLDSTE
jgi:hypothetical protein